MRKYTSIVDVSQSAAFCAGGPKKLQQPGSLISPETVPFCHTKDTVCVCVCACVCVCVCKGKVMSTDSFISDESLEIYCYD